MPEGLIESLAKQFGANRATVERYWNECKAGIHPTEEGKAGPGYGVVVNCVKAKLVARRKVRAIRKAE